MTRDAIAISELFGGAERVHTRPRGFAPWSPRPETLELIARVNAVLGEYEDHLPLTLRQIFYRLVGAHGYEKTERAYERLGEHLVRARRAGLVSMEAIRDDGGTVGDARRAAMAKELGDVLWYLSQLASELGLELDAIAAENLEKLLSRQRRGVLSGAGDDR